MDIQIQRPRVVGRETEVIVTLSRRNLLTLLSKLDWAESQKTIVRLNGDGTVLLVVRAEEDADAYQNRPAGQMHPDTEKFLKENKEAIIKRTIAALPEVLGTLPGEWPEEWGYTEDTLVQRLLKEV